MVTILNIEMKTTSTGKPYKSAKLDETVLGKDRFNVFSFHTRYEDVVTGRTFALEEFEKDGEYIKLRDPDAGIKRGGARRGGADPVAIAQAQEHKAANIKVAQDNKDYSIKVSSTARDATLILTAIMGMDDFVLTERDWKKMWVETRDWLLENWDVEDKGEIPF